MQDRQGFLPFVSSGSDFGSIVSHMLRQVLPRVSVVTEDNIEELSSIDMPLVIAFIHEHDQVSSRMFRSITEGIQDQYLLGISHDIKLSGKPSISPPFILVRSHSDHIDRIFTGLFDGSQIKNFLDEASDPLIGKFSMEAYYTYTQVGFSKSQL